MLRTKQQWIGKLHVHYTLKISTRSVLGSRNRCRVRVLADSIRGHLADGRRGEILRSGVQVAILGPPNAGKSSLLNVLARRPAAIVSSIAGTTRDVVQVPLNIAGYPVIVSDTAGIRETEDLVEKEGVLRAQQCASDADICVLMMDVQV